MAGPASAVSFDAGGYDTSIYGYARLNASYDIDENVSNDTSSFSYSDINVGAAEKNEATGYFGSEATQTRIGIVTTSPEGVEVKVEADFRGGFRLRHGYGSYKGVLAGQTWSNFSSFVGNNLHFGLRRSARFSWLSEPGSTASLHKRPDLRVS